MFIIGHRGARALGPENTLRALRRGMACADLVEVDLRLTRDGIPVAIHDATLDRTTDGTGPVKGYTLEDLAGLDAGEGETIPTLREVLALVHSDTGLVVELKEPGTEAVIVSVIMDKMPERLFLVSFHPASVAAAKNLLPGAKAGLIYSEETGDPVALARSVQADLILPRWDRVSRELVEEAHAAGLLVVPWLLNTEDDVREELRLGIDGFSSDDPCAARRYLDVAVRQASPGGA
ncbi:MULTISPECIES: glycerophosphodiester phosphodiesterase [Methanoculleus]|uniref:Glycerophosphoryl diester phosphodiesterase n=2 Tax=Methanoculleus TaxID=45989 RepID=A3CV88_METMJ|nr:MULTISPECIES: glycerophosphodiester phosphodiesterase family protein [Methanoculleus]ABN57288.1 glycerophosphoryl diester phosphodiesterase [Methanoculleus marisnigri JR1]UYU18701.1 glycerophosphodiester phosphodiesterase family protein [Methanoculleus submarinus]